ncbi:MAG: PAS domain S-box protein [Acidobacteriota bacterium]
MPDGIQARAAALLHHRVGRYALVPALLGMALALASLLHPLFPHGTEYLFLAAVIASGWLAGWGPGLLAAAAAPLLLDYFFLPPLYTAGISREAAPFILLFLLCAVAAAWMGSTRAAARQAQHLLRQSEAKFRRILTHLPDIAWTADATGRIVYISPKCEQALGYGKEQICSQGTAFLFEHVHPADQRRVRSAVGDLFRKAAAFDVEFRFRRSDGVWIWLHSRAAPYRVAGALFADGVISDITPRKQAELELQAKTAFLEAQTDATIDALLVVDANGQRILQNRRFNEMFSIPPELLDTSDDAPVLDHVVGLARDREGFLNRVMHLYTHPDATGRDEVELANGTIVDRYSAPVRGKKGQYYGRIWTFRDITQRRRNEDELRQLSAAVEQSPVSVIITDPDGRISYVNRKFTESTGYSAEEALGRNPRFLNSGHSPRALYDSLWQTIKAGREWRGEFRNQRKNGEYFWEAATISPITDAGGAICHFLAVKEDITARRALEAELRQAQKLEAIGQLAAGIAHEINTPIQFVADNLAFLQDACRAIFPLLDFCRSEIRTPTPRSAARLAEEETRCDFEFLREEMPGAIAQSLDGTSRVATIVRAMKAFSHPDLGGKDRFDLNQGIASTITITRNEWKHAAEMATDLDESLPPVLCYPGDINQVVLNLILNAAHAIRDRRQPDEKGRIAVRTRHRGDVAEIAVSDTGVGIPPEIQDRVFDPFFTTREVGLGTGQGLALAHSVIVRKHGGKIWFETEPGKGTTFYIQLPLETGPAEEKQ